LHFRHFTGPAFSSLFGPSFAGRANLGAIIAIFCNFATLQHRLCIALGCTVVSCGFQIHRTPLVQFAVNLLDNLSNDKPTAKSNRRGFSVWQLSVLSVVEQLIDELRQCDVQQQ